MEEYFSWWNVPFEFLFKSWNVSSATGLIFTCIGAFCIALLFEGIRVVSVLLHKKFYALPLKIPVRCGTSQYSDDSTGSSIHVYDTEEYAKCERRKSHCLQTVVHVVKVTLSYGLMLSLMTFNAYIAMAVIIGAGVGYYIFCYKIEALFSKPPYKSVSPATTVVTCSAPSSDPSLQSLVPSPSI